MNNETKSLRARSADYCEAYEALPDNHGYKREQMLIVLKAYEQYLEDEKEEKDEDDRGWLANDYDIGPAVFHMSVKTILVVDLVKIAPEFWDCVNGKIRLSEAGRSFLKGVPELVKGAKRILCGVGHVRRR